MSVDIIMYGEPSLWVLRDEERSGLDTEPIWARRQGVCDKMHVCQGYSVTDFVIICTSMKLGGIVKLKMLTFEIDKSTSCILQYFKSYFSIYADNMFVFTPTSDYLMK